jgi:hypothetical protein
MTLPRHQSITIEHNPHKNLYQTAKQWFEIHEISNDPPDYSAEIKEQCVAQDSIWTAQWYPDNPVGFYFQLAPTLEELLVKINEP